MNQHHDPYRNDPLVDTIIVLALTLLVLLGAFIADANSAPAQPGTKQAIARCIDRHASGPRRNECLIRVMWAPYNQSVTALKVAWCESSYNHRAVGPRDETGQPRRGLWQFGSNERRVFGYGADPVSQTNGAIAYWKYERRHGRSGWGPWECANTRTT